MNDVGKGFVHVGGNMIRLFISLLILALSAQGCVYLVEKAIDGDFTRYDNRTETDMRGDAI